MIAEHRMTYQRRQAFSDDLDFFKKTGNRLVEQDLKKQIAGDRTQDLTHPIIAARYGFSPVMKRDIEGIKLNHIVNGNHKADIGIATYEGGATPGSLNPEGEPMGQGSRAYCITCTHVSPDNMLDQPVPRTTKACTECGHDVYLQDPSTNVWKHDPGYGGRSKNFNIVKAADLDAHHDAVNPAQPETF
jgi:hypothetical protein